MKVEDARLLLESVLKTHGLYDKGWRPYMNTRIKKKLGYCSYDKKLVALSVHYITYHSLDHVLQTIYHEVAHALCKPTDGHGKKWKNKAVEIGATNPTRLIPVNKSYARAYYENVL